ncbi:hypothetical protein CLUG_00785 [Clavispora lusitaniae ATCC 42720]|uniref:Uncharacterized protein n=1 Tax=Clavispora lusitaniae (strain ATCC 42720) TaxID=306902 RepID=C4XXW2_CLAL4|nr:uncharacterized protein CLUG_00785 [Clavispora lusitaniae ATCC 42720]EEQ36663.1 hypothetical protein CLUG_00785 [Clavispora lusitaniae ATCC 42720]
MVVVTDSEHWSIDTRTQALHLLKSEQLVWSGSARLNLQKVSDCLHDFIRATQLTGRGGADLDIVLAHRVSHVHGVESGHFVHSHWRHVQHLGNVVHDRNRGETNSASAQVQQRHACALFVSRWILGNDLLGPLQVLGRELKRHSLVVLFSVSVDRDYAGSGGHFHGGIAAQSFRHVTEHDVKRLSSASEERNANSRFRCFSSMFLSGTGSFFCVRNSKMGSAHWPKVCTRTSGSVTYKTQNTRQVQRNVYRPMTQKKMFGIASQ